MKIIFIAMMASVLHGYDGTGTFPNLNGNVLVSTIDGQKVALIFENGKAYGNIIAKSGCDFAVTSNVLADYTGDSKQETIASTISGTNTNGLAVKFKISLLHNKVNDEYSVLQFARQSIDSK
jgi:hypothetical protein